MAIKSYGLTANWKEFWNGLKNSKIPQNPLAGPNRFLIPFRGRPTRVEAGSHGADIFVGGRA
jgi:hypothetical protein